MNAFTWALVVASLLTAHAYPLSAQGSSSRAPLRVYGPGGPRPAMEEAAAAFARASGIKVVVSGGPMRQWIRRATSDADVIYSGAEFMMTDSIAALAGAVDESTVVPLFLRPAALLVRPGNPKRIGGLDDVLAEGVNILVVQGAGQTGLWEDVAGRTGSIEALRAFRRNIRRVAPDSAQAKQMWTSQPELDVWLIWNIWQVANPSLAEMVPLDDAHVIYRACDVALTKRGTQRDDARRFLEFLQTPEAARIFARWGWMTASGNAGRGGTPRP